MTRNHFGKKLASPFIVSLTLRVLKFKFRVRGISIWGQITNFKCFIEEVQEVARKGIRMKGGDGAETRFWLDRWTGEECLKEVFPDYSYFRNKRMI